MSTRALLIAVCALGAPGVAAANTSHAGWPPLTGALLMNKLDQSRPLDGRPGQDPFDGADPSYACDGRPHFRPSCVLYVPPVPAPAIARAGGRACVDAVRLGLGDGSTVTLPVAVPLGLSICPAGDEAPAPAASLPAGGRVQLARAGHNELLGGHGDDTIHAGPDGDVLWGDYKPSGQPTSQVDRLYGGPGNDFIYASHGTNYIYTGGGRDVVHAHFGRGEIHCDSPADVVYLSRVSRRRYKLFGCRHISYKTLGY